MPRTLAHVCVSVCVCAEFMTPWTINQQFKVPLPQIGVTTERFYQEDDDDEEDSDNGDDDVSQNLP